MKTVDITEKLNFDSNPKLIISGKEYEVNADAATVLKIMGETGDGAVSVSAALKMYELMFSEETRAAIDKLNLQFGDLQTVVNEALDLITGGNDNRGE